MPKPYPEEFRQDVVRVARNPGPGVTVEQVATDFGVHPMTLWKWIRRADIDDGTGPGVTSQDSAELREARRRIKLLERENEVLRRAAAYLSQADNSSTRSFTSSRTWAAVRPELPGAGGAGSAPVFRVQAAEVPPVIPDRTPRPRRY
ncbi:transposase [Streptomyces sp. NPDC013157]|uniref:transposase n=1 Tax=Streptomyces sp. NPDC013157 TaxID=3364861 RepID=UPI00368C174E